MEKTTNQIHWFLHASVCDCRAGLSSSASDCIAVIRASRDTSRDSTCCQSDQQLMWSVERSCETAVVVVLDDVSLSLMRLTQLSHYRWITRDTDYFDPCFRRLSVTRLRCTNWTDHGPAWNGDSWGPKERCGRWGSRLSHTDSTQPSPNYFHRLFFFFPLQLLEVKEQSPPTTPHPPHKNLESNERNAFIEMTSPRAAQHTCWEINK